MLALRSCPALIKVKDSATPYNTCVGVLDRRHGYQALTAFTLHACIGIKIHVPLKGSNTVCLTDTLSESVLPLSSKVIGWPACLRCTLTKETQVFVCGRSSRCRLHHAAASSSCCCDFKSVVRTTQEFSQAKVNGALPLRSTTAQR